MNAMKRLNIIAFARVQALLMTLVGLLCGIVYAFGGFAVDIGISLGWLSSAAADSPGLGLGTFLAFGALLAMPLIGAVIGFVIGILEAVLYNLFTKWFKGFSFDFD